MKVVSKRPVTVWRLNHLKSLLQRLSVIVFIEQLMQVFKIEFRIIWNICLPVFLLVFLFLLSYDAILLLCEFYLLKLKMRHTKVRRWIAETFEIIEHKQFSVWYRGILMPFHCPIFALNLLSSIKLFQIFRKMDLV